MSELQEEQQALYHKILLMSEDLKKETNSLRRNAQELKENLKLFSPSQEAFKSLSERIEHMVATALLEISRQIIKDAQGQYDEKQVQAIVSQGSQHLEENTAQAEATLAQVQKALSLRSWLIWLTSLLAVILEALSISYFYLSRIESS